MSIRLSPLINSLRAGSALSGSEKIVGADGTGAASWTPTQFAAYVLASPALTGTATAPTPAAADSSSKIATTAFVAGEIATAVTGVLKYQGDQDCSGNPNYPAATKGWAYLVTVAGKIGGASGVSVDAGDVFYARATNAGGTQAAVGTSWGVLEHNLAGALLAANNLSDVLSPSAARSNLGLGSMAIQAASNVAITGGSLAAAILAISGNAGASYKTAGHYPNLSFPPVILAAGSSGNNDLYTVPTGRKAIVFALMYGNNSGAGTITFTPQIKISGTYYKLAASTPANAGGVGGSVTHVVPILLNAGEIYSVNADIAGLQLQGVEIYEFDATSPLARADLKTFSVGFNTLFTVPSGHSAQVGAAAITGTAANTIAYVNQSGGARTIEMYRVPSSYTLVNSSADYPYLINQASPANNAVATKGVYGGLAAGDYLSVKSDSAASGQFAWVLYLLQ